MGNGAVAVDEFVSEVDPENVLLIGKFPDDLIDLKNLAAQCARILAAREDRQQEHFGLRQFFTEFAHDGRHPVGDLVHGVVFAVGIVRPDHDHGGPGFEAIEIAVVEPPKHVLRAVAADAEVDRIARRVKIRPHLLPFAFPTLRDRVADKNNLRLIAGFGGAFVQQFLAILPALISARDGFDGGMAGRANGRERDHEQPEGGMWKFHDVSMAVPGNRSKSAQAEFTTRCRNPRHDCWRRPRTWRAPDRSRSP